MKKRKKDKENDHNYDKNKVISFRKRENNRRTQEPC